MEVGQPAGGFYALASLLPGAPRQWNAYALGFMWCPGLAALVTISASGEEIGWRGFLVPRMHVLVGFTGTSLLVGLVWAAWHYPIDIATSEADMAHTDGDVLDALIDSWDRNNTITVNLLRALPEGSMDLRAAEGSPTVAQMFAHMHYARVVSVFEVAPEIPGGRPHNEWAEERDRDRIAALLAESARMVRDAVRTRLESGRPMDRRYDHPILMFQHLIWHEGYHHAQIKLALKVAGRPFDDEEIGPGTWDVWMEKTR